jgi:hypothetical protein
MLQQPQEIIHNAVRTDFNILDSELKQELGISVIHVHFAKLHISRWMDEWKDESVDRMTNGLNKQQNGDIVGEC